MRFYCGIQQKTAGLSQGRVPICPRDGSRMSQERFLFVPNTVLPKMFVFIGFILARFKAVTVTASISSNNSPRRTHSCMYRFLPGWYFFEFRVFSLRGKRLHKNPPFSCKSLIFVNSARFSREKNTPNLEKCPGFAKPTFFSYSKGPVVLKILRSY